jgi:hypothetical protein
MARRWSSGAVIELDRYDRARRTRDQGEVQAKLETRDAKQPQRSPHKRQAISRSAE